ncbi:MAG: potassium channel family protein [Candidatus Micrarchaeales archaeon]
MVNVTKTDTRNTTNRLVVLLALAAVFFTGLSVVVITEIVHNTYVAGYYTISALFDAVGVDESAALSTTVPFFTTPFYLIVGISIVDGLIKILIVGFFIAAFIEVLTSIDISSRIVSIAKRNWKNHIIICGYSFLAEKVALELIQKKVQFIIIDKNPTKVDEVREAGYISLHEDFTTDIALKNASIATARAVMFLTVDDYDNLLGVITARHLNKGIKIIARAGDSNSITKIHRAGAELCVVPEVLAGLDLGDAIIAKR